MADLRSQPWNQMTLAVEPRDRISNNFLAYELTKSETAERQGIVNSFTSLDHIRAAVYLCRAILQPVRDEFGRFTPNSVYRCQELERALKKKRKDWTSKSQHTRGQACDIEVPGMTTMHLAKWVAQNLNFDQIICECYDPAKGPNSGWVHVSLVPPGMGENRGSILSYVMDPATGRYIYVKGLKESPES